MKMHNKDQVDKRHPEGSILLLTLIILLLMTLMGAALLHSTKTEYQIAGNTFMGRDAFTKAESAIQVGLLVGRLLIHKGLEGVNRVITNPANGYSIIINQNLSLYEAKKLGAERTRAGSKRRYLMALANNTPHIEIVTTVDGQDQVVASAVIAIEIADAKVGGMSTDQGDYDDAGGSVQDIFIVVTATGRSPRGGDGNYNTGNSEDAHSVITAIFREKMSN